MGEALITLREVSRYYQQERIHALNRVNLDLNENSWLTIMGSSGSGKSTLLNIIAGLDTPTSGEVHIDGIVSPTPSQWTTIRAQKLGFVFQSFNLLPTYNALENVEIPMIGILNDPRGRRRRAGRLLSMVSMTDRAGHLPKNLSAGEKQRVAIARALANNPKLILADEPTGNLDLSNKIAIINLLKELKEMHRTAVVMVTHDPMVVKQCQSRLGRMVDGRLDLDVELD
jgi:putative ABC transport system ATP-binding protein